MACAVSGVRKFPTLPKYPGFLQRLSNSPETTNTAVLVLVNRKNSDRYIALPLRDA